MTLYKLIWEKLNQKIFTNYLMTKPIQTIKLVPNGEAKVSL